MPTRFSEVKLSKICLILTLIPIASTYITGLEPRFLVEGTQYAPGSPWPMPFDWRPSSILLTLDPSNFEFSTNTHCDVILKAFERYQKYIFFNPEQGRADSQLDKVTRLQVLVTESYCDYPRPEENESYKLTVTQGTSKLSSATVWGALRGLETFSQLVYQEETIKTYRIAETEIVDKPTYAYRGIMLDTARHFQPMHILLQNLEAMSMNKFNVFHWHIVDDQSFPFESQVYPNLTIKGAYSPKHIYTHDDVREVIEYARLRGIRVIPEFDSPGHTHSFGKAFPDLITPCYGQGDDFPNTANFPIHSENEVINPTLSKSYEVLKILYLEVKSLFKDSYVHLGMDEVNYACWQSNPKIRAFMTEHHLNSVTELEQYYVFTTLKNIKDIGYNYMVWQDPIENGVKFDPETVVQIWKENINEMPSVKQIARQKLKMVVSYCWYLNLISYGEDWKTYYNCNPRESVTEYEEQKLVIGGEACLWAEYIDATNIISRLWPRASAVGERLWTKEELLDVKSAQFRLDEHRCRMLRRGIPTGPILNGFCGDYDWGLNEKEIKVTTNVYTKFTSISSRSFSEIIVEAALIAFFIIVFVLLTKSNRLCSICSSTAKIISKIRYKKLPV